MEHSLFDKTPRTRGRKWMEMRSVWLMQHPLCKYCQHKGRISLATEVDHIHPLFKGGTDDPNNLQSLCHDCHVNKTKEDLNQRASKPIGLDGVPEGWT